MRLLIGVIWGLSLIGAYFLGAAQSNPDPTNSPGETWLKVSSQQQQNDPGVNQSLPAEQPEVPASQATPNPSKSANSMSVSELVARTQELMLSSGWAPSMAKIAQAYVMVSELSLQQAMEALNLIEFNDDSAENMQLATLFLGRVAELSPQQALDYVNDNLQEGPLRERALLTVLSTWSEQEPQSALNWFLNQAPQTKQQGAGRFVLVSLYRNYAREDFYQAVDSLETAFNQDDFRDIEIAVRGIVMGNDQSADYDYLFSRIQTLGNDKALEAVFTSWIVNNSEQALVRLDELGDPALINRIEQSAFRQWMINSPTEAADRYMQRAAPENKQSRASLIVDTMTFRDPQQTLDWVNRQSDLDTQALTGNVIARSAYINPQFAEQHLHLINDQTERSRISAQVYLSHENYNPKIAEEFLARQPNQQQIKAEISKVKEAIEKSRQPRG